MAHKPLLGIALLLILIGLPVCLYAQTTATSGSWVDGSTWVGGVAPGTNISTGTVTIAHAVALNNSLSVSATMNVNTGASLTIAQNLTHSGGNIAIAGTVIVEGNLIVNGGNLNIHNGGTLIVYGSLTYSVGSINVNSDGRFILFGDYNQTGGNFNNGGIFLVAGNFNATGGNADNNGTTYLFDESPRFALGNNWNCPPPPGVCQYRNFNDAVAVGLWGSFGSQTTWYSYRTGNFTHPDTWTTDPGGTTLVGTHTLAPGNSYVILPGRTVTLTADVPTTGLSVTISDGAFLNLGGWVFTQSLARLAGQGTLRVSNSVLPSVSSNPFVGPNGGTVEFNNAASFTLPASWSTYNHLNINLNNILDRATMLHHLSLNGDLNVTRGGFQINSNTSTTKLNLTILGSVGVSANGSISVGTGSTNTVVSPLGITGGTAPFLNYYEHFHRVVIHGDLINNGTVRFTNLTFPVYNAFPPTTSSPTSGAASVYFMGNNNSSLVCNGPTDFYNLILDKGTDQTFELSVSSAQYNYFRLFGANIAGGEGGGDNPLLKKALWLRNGTMRLFGRVVIPSLSEGFCATESTAPNPTSDFFIPANAGLVIEGPDVIVLTTATSFLEVNAAYGVGATSDDAMGIHTGGVCSSFSILGTFIMNNGYLSTRESAGIIYWGAASGQIIINGGRVDAKQLRTAGTSGGLTAFRQTGGTLSLRGRFTQTITAATITTASSLALVPLNTTRNAVGLEGTVGTFNIDRDDNIFEMSGGTIEVLDVA